MKKFLCQEDTEQFIIEAESRAEAEAGAAMYNAVVIKEIRPKKEKKNG